MFKKALRGGGGGGGGSHPNPSPFRTGMVKIVNEY